MIAVIIIGSRCGLRIEACHRNQPNKSCISCSTRPSASVIKVGVVGVVHLSCAHL